jgi:hypothetical protein
MWRYKNGKKTADIGGVAGGATAASRARRLDETAEIILFERANISLLPTAACLLFR